MKHYVFTSKFFFPLLNPKLVAKFLITAVDKYTKDDPIIKPLSLLLIYMY